MNKVIRDGNVAVLYSPGHGAGWWTWNTEHTDLLFDPGMVDLVDEYNKIEGYDVDKLRVYAELKWPDCYLGGLDCLQIAWVPQGTKFIVNEYDGSESVTPLDSINWITA